MRSDGFSFGSIRIDGHTYDRDVVIDRGQVLRRQKKASKPWRQEFGHTPLSVKEAIPWSCKRLIIGTGADGGLPVMDAVVEEAQRRGVKLVVLPTKQAIQLLAHGKQATNAVLHITC